MKTKTATKIDLRSDQDIINSTLFTDQDAWTFGCFDHEWDEHDMLSVTIHRDKIADYLWLKATVTVVRKSTPITEPIRINA